MGSQGLLTGGRVAQIEVIQFVDAYPMSAGIVDFMIPAGRFDGERIKSCLRRFLVAQSCPGNHHLKYLDHLGAKCPGELPVTTNRVLTGYAPLLMGRGT